MIRYLETKDSTDRPILIKIDAIKEVGTYSGAGPNENLCLVNGSVVQMSFNQVKAVLEADDHRQVVDYEKWPPVLLWLARNRVCDTIKLLGPDRAVEFYYDLIAHCKTEAECQQLWWDHVKAEEEPK